MKKRNEYPQIITPRGEVAWAQLNEPDYEYKKDTGEFHVRIRPDTNDPQYAVLVEAAERVRDEFYDEKVEQLTREKKGALLKKMHKRDVVQEEIDRETGDPTGSMVLRAGEAYHITIKNGPKAGKEFYKVPDFFDARGQRLRSPPKIGSGSVLKLGVRLMPYLANDDGEVGISYKLEGVQIIKLVEGGQRTASSYGFGEEPDGDVIEDQGGFADEGDGFDAGSAQDPKRDF